MAKFVDINGVVVQLVRAPPCHGGSCEFESRRPRTSPASRKWILGFCIFMEFDF